MSAVGNRINQRVNPFLSISRFVLLKGFQQGAANDCCQSWLNSFNATSIKEKVGSIMCSHLVISTSGLTELIGMEVQCEVMVAEVEVRLLGIKMSFDPP